MAENPSLKVVKSLKTLMSIYRGNGQSKQKSEGVTYTLDMVMDKLGISEKEYLGWKIKAHLRTDTQVNSGKHFFFSYIYQSKKIGEKEKIYSFYS